MAKIPGGFFRCECGKIHMTSVLASVCPRCGFDLRWYQFSSGPKPVENKGLSASS